MIFVLSAVWIWLDCYKKYQILPASYLTIQHSYSSNPDNSQARLGIHIWSKFYNSLNLIKVPPVPPPRNIWDESQRLGCVGSLDIWIQGRALTGLQSYKNLARTVGVCCTGSTMDPGDNLSLDLTGNISKLNSFKCSQLKMLIWRFQYHS